MGKMPCVMEKCQGNFFRVRRLTGPDLIRNSQFHGEANICVEYDIAFVRISNEYFEFLFGEGPFPIDGYEVCHSHMKRPAILEMSTSLQGKHSERRTPRCQTRRHYRGWTNFANGDDD